MVYINQKPLFPRVHVLTSLTNQRIQKISRYFYVMHWMAQWSTMDNIMKKTHILLALIFAPTSIHSWEIGSTDENARMQWILMWVTFLIVTLLPSTCVVLRPVVCTSTLFLWTVRKPLSRHWDRRYWLLISVHCWLVSSVITFCLLTPSPLTPGLATSEPLLPVAGDCGAPDNVRGWHGPMVNRHSTKAARTLNLKIVWCKT